MIEWGTFFTWVAQGLIVLIILFVVAAVVTGIVKNEKKSPRDPRDGSITNIWNNGGTEK